MADETPVDDVLKMIQLGMNDADIIRRLTDEGYSPVQISDALNQAKIKQEIAPQGLTPSIMTQPPEEKPFVPKPSVPRPMAVSPSQPMPRRVQAAPEEAYPYPYTYPTQMQEAPQGKLDTEEIEEIAEEIVEEKWTEIKGRISDVLEWKDYADKRLNTLDDRVKRIEMSMDRLQAALLAKVQEYGRDVKDLGAEMNSMENAFGKILNPLVDNVKELGRITDDMKRGRSSERSAPVKTAK